MNKYPMQRQAQQLQAQGRYGDSVLVHMNPAEVAGIAALTPGGLTRNPQTGQPEAFAFLVPMLASWGASSLGGTALAGALGVSAGMGSALAGGLASGLSTAAITGDLKRGLVSGVTGAALGGAANAGLAPEAAKAVTDPVTNVATQAAKDIAAQTPLNTGLGLSQAGNASAQGLAASQTNGIVNAMNPAEQFSPLAKQMTPEGLIDFDTGGGASFVRPSSTVNKMFGDGPQSPLPGAGGYKESLMDVPAMAAGPSAGNRLMQGAKNIGTNIFKPQYMIPTYMGLSTEAQMAADADAEEFRNKKRGEQEGKRRKTSDMLRRIYGGYSSGGIVRLQGGGETDPTQKQPGDGDTEPPVEPNPLDREGWGPGDYERLAGWYMTQLGWTPWGGHQGYADRTPESVQKYLHQMIPLNHDVYAPYQTVAPPKDYQPGFNPEFTYIQRKGANYVPEYTRGPYGWSEPSYYYPYASPVNRFLQTGQQTPTWWPYNANRQPYFSSIMGGKGGRYAGGGRVKLADGGIAELQQPPQMALQPEPQGQPSPQELEMVAMAIAGMAGEQGQKIIDGFIKKYGPDVFRRVREMVLQSIQPNAQTEGMVQGQGGGMDDQVRGMIGAEQPVAVSPGEYIVPADVVSGLGDGSSDAGARELDQMSRKVRMARGGSTMQPPALEASRYMPR